MLGYEYARALRPASVHPGTSVQNRGVITRPAKNMDDLLKFELEDSPSWRSSEDTTTSEMLKEIAEMVERYETLPEEAHKFSRNEFARAMAVDYVYNLNVGEVVGTQTKDETETLLERFFDGKELQESDKSKERMETITVVPQPIRSRDFYFFAYVIFKAQE